MTAHRFVCIDLLVNRLVADLQLADNLLGAPLQPQKLACLRFHPGCKLVGVAARFGAFEGKFTGLFGFIATTPGIGAQLGTDCGIIASKQPGNLRDGVLGFHKTVNLISLNLAEVFVIHRAISTCRSGCIEC